MSDESDPVPAKGPAAPSGAAASDRAPDGSSGADGLPLLDFSTFVMSVIGSALVYLGDAPDPDVPAAAGARAPNLVLARQNIELLALLQDKTTGNLTGEEERVLGQGLYDLRMRYVEVAKGPRLGRSPDGSP